MIKQLMEIESFGLSFYLQAGLSTSNFFLYLIPMQLDGHCKRHENLERIESNRIIRARIESELNFTLQGCYASDSENNTSQERIHMNTTLAVCIGFCYVMGQDTKRKATAETNTTTISKRNPPPQKLSKRKREQNSGAPSCSDHGIQIQTVPYHQSDRPADSEFPDEPR